MKNFTNNFKQFTSRLSARWLIMALMMLVGTSSAWAAYYVTGDAFGSWGTWYELKYETANRYTRSISNINGEFKLSSGQTYDNCWNSLGCGNGVKCGVGSNHKMLGVTGILCFDPSGNNGNGYIRVEEVIQEPSAYSLGGYINQSDVKSYSDTYKLTKQNDGTYKRTISFTKVHNNAQYLWIIDDLGNKWGVSSDTDLTTGNSITLTKGVESGKVKAIGVINTDYVFIFNPSNGVLSYLASCSTPNFSVSLSKSEVAVGCTGVTASIKGDDRPTVTWSSSVPKVATIGSDGAIIINAAGTTTIIATTTEADGFCGGVEKKATLTVKSPSVKVSPNKNSLCEDETLTLTATLTNCGADNSIQWYKGEDLLTGETKDQLTISSVTTTNSGEYKAVVTGGIICSSIESSAVTITVNALPNAPSLSNPAPVCEGTTFTLPEKDDSKKTITWNVNNRELTNLSVGPHTYTAKIVENGCESTTVDYTITVKEQLAKPDLAVTNVKQCGSNYTEGKIVISYHDPNNTYILKKEGETIDKTYNNGYSLSENEIGTYTVEVSKDGACGATSDDVTIEVINNTPTVTPFEITKQPNVCMGNPVTLSYNDTEQSGTVSYAWYEGTNREVLGTEKTFTIQQAKNATYKLVVTVTSNSCPANGEAEITVAPKAVPVAPTFDQDEMSACVGERFELPKPNNLIGEEEALWTVEGLPTAASQTIDEDGEYRYIAYKNDGCPSQGTPFIVHVNPLPTINIGEDVTAVKFEDVELTATGENIHNVEWTADKGTITKDPTDPKRAILTYDQTGDVIVTAKAISAAGCESAEVSKKVTFGEETCKPTTITVPANYIEIYCKYNDAPTQHDMKVDIWKQSEGQGTESYQSCSKSVDGYAYWKFNITDDATYCIRISNKETNYKSGSMCTLTRGHKYYFDIPRSWSGWTGGPDKSKTKDITETQDGPPAITAPAVKMVSAEYDEVNDKIVAKGAVYKTGCGTTFWGFQYSTDGQKWGTEEIDYIRPNSGNSLTKAGEFEYSFAIPKAGGGDIYYIRAYALNNYNGSYALSNAVYSATSLPVEIPSKTIESATISLVDSEGKPSDVIEVCPQSKVYLKVSYVGGDFKDFEAADNFPGTNLELVNHDKVNNYAIFSYTATTTGVANITISNENTSVTPETGVSITVKNVAIATPPTIYLEKNTICDNQTTNVVVNSPIVGFIYSLKNGSVGDPITCESEDLKFSVSKEGSYTVQVQEPVCGTTAISAPVDLRVITSDVKITLTTDVNTITPWQPLTLTVKAPSGYDYDLQGLDGTVYTKSGDVYTIKFPRPDSWGVGNSASNSEPKTFIAGIKAGEEPSCSTTTKEIQLIDTEEVCLAPGN